METEDFIPEQNQEPEVEIYSKRAVWWFSIIFSPFFGAILLSINLWEAGYKKEISKIVLFTIAWFYISGLVVSRIPIDPRFTSVAFNVAGAAILAEYFFVKYFPEKDYYPKSVITPIFISLLIVIPLSIMMYKMGYLK